MCLCVCLNGTQKESKKKRAVPIPPHRIGFDCSVHCWYTCTRTSLSSSHHLSLHSSKRASCSAVTTLTFSTHAHTHTHTTRYYHISVPPPFGFHMSQVRLLFQALSHLIDPNRSTSPFNPQVFACGISTLLCLTDTVWLMIFPVMCLDWPGCCSHTHHTGCETLNSPRGRLRFAERHWSAKAPDIFYWANALWVSFTSLSSSWWNPARQLLLCVWTLTFAASFSTSPLTFFLKVSRFHHICRI